MFFTEFTGNMGRLDLTYGGQYVGQTNPDSNIVLHCWLSKVKTKASDTSCRGLNSYCYIVSEPVWHAL